jgi:ankyrin repeat protein
MLAAKSGAAGVVAELLDAGADPELKDKQGMTAVDYASAIGSPDLVKLFDPGARATATQQQEQ